MKYEFPEIHTLEDVLPAIEGRPEFVVAHRPWGIVVNYHVVMPDTFPEVKTAGGSAKMRAEATRMKAIRRECRGLIFDLDGKIMSRRLHKFFNVNERDETLASKIDLSQPHVILEKLDGSMVTPIFVGDEVLWGTKMGVTEVSAQAAAFVEKNPDYLRIVDVCRETGHTPIFEWCSRQQRIVVEYAEDRLVLIAVRNIKTGEYVSQKTMETMARMLGVDCVKTFPGTAESMESLIDHTRSLEGVEGWVVRFHDGHMVKIKADWYVRIHKVKDDLLFEKNVIDLIVNENIDDAKPFMLEDDRRRIEAFEGEFWAGVDRAVELYDFAFNNLLQEDILDKKSYALTVMKTDQTVDPFMPGMMFGRFDAKDTRTMVIDQIRKNLSTQTKVDGARQLWGHARWSFQSENGA